MLKLFDRNHNAIGHIVKYKDCKIESDVFTGDKTLCFTYLAKHHSLKNEMYVRTKEDEYVIKEVPAASGSFPQIVAVLNLEDLQRDAWQTFSVTDTTIEEAARTVLAGTGWTVGYSDVTKRRNAGMMQVSSLDVIQNLCKAFMCEPEFDTIRKTVSFYKKRGEDRGVYFMSGLNLKKLQKKSTSYDFFTRIIPIGANGLTVESVNDGKNYLENHQYSDKVITYIWKDESYTDPQALKEDAQLKLDDMSKPEISFQAEVRNLAAQKPEYSILSYREGDTIRLIDEETGIMESQRIVKLVHYPQNPDKDTCEIANIVPTFEELQQKYQEAANIINMTVTGDGRYTGTINVSDILHFEQGVAESSTVGALQSTMATTQGEIAQVKVRIGEVEANYLKSEVADIRYATIENTKILEADIHSLQGDYAAFKSLTTNEFASHTALIDKIYNEELVTAKGWMLEGAIGDAQISKVSANKLDAGTINTAVVNIAGTDGRLLISDNTIQISDTDHVRVQVGKDASGDYTLAVWDAAGNLIWDALGATENTIQRKIIRDRMVADDAAIQAMKIDFQSFETALTDQGVTISGTVVQVGEKSLNVALTEQTQTITEHGEMLMDHAAKITANEKEIKLKVDTQTYQTDKSNMDSALAKATSEITVLQEQISLKLEQTDIENIMDGYSTISQVEAAIELARTGILSTVSNSYAAKDDMEQVSTIAHQTADRFSWLVSSGTSATDFTLTERTAQLITDSLTIKDKTGEATIISGGRMDIAQIFAQDITATGTIRGVKLIGAQGEFSGIVKTNELYVNDAIIKSITDTVDIWDIVESDGELTKFVTEEVYAPSVGGDANAGGALQLTAFKGIRINGNLYGMSRVTCNKSRSLECCTDEMKSLNAETNTLKVYKEITGPFITKIKNDISLLNTNMKKTEYHAGDTINLYFIGSGYITSSNTAAYVTIPLMKPIGTDVKNIAITLNRAEMRQGGKYLVNGDATGITANFAKSTTDFARLMLTKSSGFGGTNNDVVGIMVSGKIVLS